MADFDKLKKLCQLIRYDILTSTTEAGSGHPSSCLSAVELMTTLFFGAESNSAGGFYHFDLKNPHNLVNDRVIFSKGHAAPLLYSLYHAAGAISYREILSLRKFNSNLEGHPTPRFPYVDVATGSLGQGLSAGVGMALGIRLTIENRKWKVGVEDRRSKVEKNQSSIPKVFVLLGDSEMAEGQVWEAIQIASYYKLNNLIAIADVNRLGQSTETMLGWDLKTYTKRIESFGWNTIIVEDGHDISQVYKAFNQIESDRIRQSQMKSDKISKNTADYIRLNPITSERPVMILARTIKGKGVSFLENKEGWHGKPVPKDMLKSALKELGKVDLKVKGEIQLPKYQILNIKYQKDISKIKNIPNYKMQDLVATRMAYGDALVALGNDNDKVVVFDAEVSNSTFSEKFAKKFANRYFEMFIAEQNMISTALGLSKLGFIPFASTFAAFLTRGFDQIRMAQYSAPNLKIVGSHCGVSIGPDGPSQMGLEDLAMFRSILNSIIFYPADAVSTFKLTEVMANKNGLFYLRTNRKETPVIYDEREEFKIGGSKIHYIKDQKSKIKTTNQKLKIKTLIIGAGITLHEALKAQEKLAQEGIETIVVDLYCIKPIDQQTIQQLAINISNIIVVEDHYPAGGIGEAVLSVLNTMIEKNQSSIVNRLLSINFIHLCVRKLPRSGTPEELLHFEEIDSEAIIKAVKKLPPSSLISP